MEKFVSSFWHHRLNHLKENLERNNFEVLIASSKDNAKEIFLNKILIPNKIASISHDGSTTIMQLGIDEILTNDLKTKYIWH